MGKAKRTRISQRMSQHIMQLKLALHIRFSAGLTYQDDMFITHRISLVNTFFPPFYLPKPLQGFFPQPVCRSCRIFSIFRARDTRPLTLTAHSQRAVGREFF